MRSRIPSDTLPVVTSTADPADTPAQPGTRAGGDIRLFLCGDVMTGRGIDQVLPHPCKPRLYEPAIRSARDYVRLAERANGRIGERGHLGRPWVFRRPVGFGYPWGDALGELDRRRPAARIINLETSVTRSATPEDKRINYRMSPENFSCISAAAVDCCVLANNHVLDWGEAGLNDTLATIRDAGIAAAGAGGSKEKAGRPAILSQVEGARVLVFAFACESSGVPASWRARPDGPGINLLPDLSDRTVRDIVRQTAAMKRPGDIVILSIHWGGNWGYEIPASQTTFAHRLIDDGGVDIVHGHSSHHPKGIEVYRDRLILYGCGDFLNDYEGIAGQEEYRGDLVLMYLPVLRPADGALVELTMVPFRIRNFRLAYASSSDADWLAALLDREGRQFGTRVRIAEPGDLRLEWG